MPTFDIIKKSEIKKTYRVARIMSDFDVKTEHSNEHFVGELKLPAEWNIGVIVGGSGTGKSTIANELFGDKIYIPSNYTAESVIDDMPQDVSMNDIQKMFYAVGFGSVPSWLKPYSVLSNGEKMRVDIARALLERNFVVFDEFTSVVDRQVAQVASLAISKAIKRTNKKFVAITCHYDVIEWLQPDWIFDTETMKTNFQQTHIQKSNSSSENVGKSNGRSLDVITI